MNVATGTEAAQFPEMDYIIGIFLAVLGKVYTHLSDLYFTEKLCEGTEFTILNLSYGHSVGMPNIYS